MKKISLLLILFLLSCERNQTFINLSEFKEITKLDVQNFDPNKNISYWDYSEECSNGENGEYRILVNYAKGKQSEELKTEYTKANFQHPIHHFLGECAHCCYKLIRFETSNKLSILKFYQNKDLLLEFLGDINTIQEAYWLLKNSGYNTLTTNNPVFIKETDKGYELIAEKEISICEPYVIEKHHVMISPKGDLQILSKEVIVNKNVCVNF